MFSVLRPGVFDHNPAAWILRNIQVPDTSRPHAGLRQARRAAGQPPAGLTDCCERGRSGGRAQFERGRSGGRADAKRSAGRLTKLAGVRLPAAVPGLAVRYLYLNFIDFINFINFINFMIFIFS